MEKDWEEARRRKHLEQRVLRLEQELETPVATAIAEAGGFETLAVGPVAEGDVLVREGRRVAGTPWAHESRHRSGSPDALQGTLDANARLEVQSSGTAVGTRRALNLVPGTGVVISAVDNPDQERVDVTLTATGGGGGGGPHAQTHESGGTDPIVGPMDGNARVQVQAAGVPVGTRRTLNLLAGPGMTISAADNPAQERVDVTLESTTQPHAATHQSGGSDPITGSLHLSSGSLSAAGGLFADALSERSTGAGVTVAGALVKNALVQSFRSVTLEDPKLGDDIVLLRAPAPLTITAVYAVIKGGTSATWQLVHGPDRSATGSAVFQTPQTANSSTTGTTHDSGWNTPDVASGSWLRLLVVGVSGAVTQLHLTIQYRPT